MDAPVLSRSRVDDDFDLASWGVSELIYVRALTAGQLADELRSQGAEVETDLPDHAPVYALHAADGSRLAVMTDERAAFAAAHDNEMEVVSRH